MAFKKCIGCFKVVVFHAWKTCLLSLFGLLEMALIIALAFVVLKMLHNLVLVQNDERESSKSAWADITFILKALLEIAFPFLFFFCKSVV